MSFSIEASKNEKEWDQYVGAHSEGSIYHLTAWKNAVERTFRRKSAYFVAREKGALCGVLPLFVIRTLFSGRKAVSIPYAMYGGILADSRECEDALLTFALDHAQSQGAGHLEMRCLEERNYTVPKNDLYVTYIGALAGTDEELLASIPKKSRYSVRHGYDRFGLTAHFGLDLSTLYHLYALNKRELGSPAYPVEFFQHLIQGFEGQSVIAMVRYQGKPAAGVLAFVWNGTIYPYFSGCDSQYNFTGSNNVLYYELMKYAIRNGIRRFDFGRSRKETGASEFKRHMGFEPRALHYYFFLHGKESVPNISPSNAKFKALTKLWQRLPLPLANWLGPVLVRYIP